MEVITRYRTNDGQEFESEELCLAHEKATETAMEAVKIIQSNCRSFFKIDELCIGCPFAYTDEHKHPCCVIDDYPLNWKVPD